MRIDDDREKERAMTFQPIDMETYPRREHFEQFRAMRLTFSATVDIDITALRRAANAANARVYLAQIWMLTTAANRVPEFRLSVNDEGVLGTWEVLDPLYTVLNAEKQTFSSLWTPYSAEFGAFSRDCLATIERFGDGSFEPQANVPAHVLNVSSIPWVEFTSFNLNLPTDFLLPILTIGKYRSREDRTLLPLAVQVHHAVCDGWHLGRFVEQVQAIADDADSWIAG